MRKIWVTAILSLILFSVFSQNSANKQSMPFPSLLSGDSTWGFQRNNPIDPSQIDIVRDHFGVPHIFAKTDPEVAFGLAWAHAEDDFNTLQKAIL
ncbi:MAG TPA: penicillin acylase family protein, partial [Chryseosolibacter sp.]